MENKLNHHIMVGVIGFIPRGNLTS